MTREEALTHFKSYAGELLKDYKQIFWVELQEKYLPFLKESVEESLMALKELCKKANKEEIVYFQFSLLRTDLVKRQFTLLLHGYDVRWYLDDEPLIVQTQLNRIFSSILPLWDQLLLEQKKYVGKVNAYDVQAIIHEEIMACNKLIAHTLRLTMRDIEKTELLKDLPLAKMWVFRWGEYRDDSEIVFLVDRESKTPKDWEDAMDKLAYQEDALVCTYWYELDLENQKCEHQKMYFSGFEKSRLTHSSFMGTQLIGAKFRNCTIKSCSFKEANLRNADFRETHFEDVDFEGADLTGTTFSDVDVSYLHLTPEQLQMIQIERSKPSEIL